MPFLFCGDQRDGKAVNLIDEGVIDLIGTGGGWVDGPVNAKSMQPGA